MDFFEIDIVGLINSSAAKHGLTETDVDLLLSELDRSAEKMGIEPDSLYMILLDSISGQQPCSRDQILHQIKVMLNNQGTLKYFPA